MEVEPPPFLRTLTSILYLYMSWGICGIYAQCVSDIHHLGTRADTRNRATFELFMRHNFVALNGHVLIYCFFGISLVLNCIFSDETEHLSRIYMLSLVLTRDSNYSLAAHLKDNSRSTWSSKVEKKRNMQQFTVSEWLKTMHGAESGS